MFDTKTEPSGGALEDIGCGSSGKFRGGKEKVGRAQ